jgi:hypothetical protein
MTVELLNPLRAPWNVEQAVLATLKEWMPAYLYAVEEQNGLHHKALGRPPAPESYKGGLDWETVEQEWVPAVIVNANPVGEPERSAQIYIQDWQVQVGCVVVSREGTDPESSARRTAGLFAAATMLLAHHGGLGGFAAEETLLTGAPKVEFFNPERRDVAVGVTEWHVFTELLKPNGGPTVLKTTEPEGPYPEWPESSKDTITVVGEPVITPL